VVKVLTSEEEIAMILLVLILELTVQQLNPSPKSQLYFLRLVYAIWVVKDLD
jgi:hypothetical protein